ncbi:MAG: ABC transporter substrate-binding protein [Ilumatobacteraceae bacterium]
MTDDTEAMTEDTDAMASGDGLSARGRRRSRRRHRAEARRVPGLGPVHRVTDSEIRWPDAAPVGSAGVVRVDRGIQMYFDYINETDPVEGKDLVLITKDDGYEAGRAVANVEEMIDTENILGLVHSIGTPVNV